MCSLCNLPLVCDLELKLLPTVPFFTDRAVAAILDSSIAPNLKVVSTPSVMLL